MNASRPMAATNENGRRTVSLGEIAEVKLGKMLDKSKHLSGRRLPYLRNINIRWGRVDTADLLEMNFDDDEVDRFGLKKGDVLVCEGGEPGRAAIWNDELPNIKFQKAIHRVRFNQPYDQRLFVYLLELLAKTGRLERRFTGSTIKHFTREGFVQLPIPNPPLDEQRRIVAEIEKQFTRLEAGVAALLSIQTKLKRCRAAVLKAACEENDWTKVKLGDVVSSMKNGIYKPRSAYADEGVACLRMYNIENGNIVWKNIKRMKLTKKDIDEYQLLPGDLLVNRVNSRELVGKAAPIPEGLESCVFESKNIRVRFKRDIANPKFVGFAMAIYGQAHFNRNAQQVVGMASISQPQVAALQIPLPPLTEQTRIVVVRANLQRAARLRQSILEKAFAGKL